MNHLYFFFNFIKIFKIPINLGNSISNYLLVTSNEGLVFTSINHGLNYSSKMKSNPKTSKQYFLLNLFILCLTLQNTHKAIDLIFSIT